MAGWLAGAVAMAIVALAPAAAIASEAEPAEVCAADRIAFLTEGGPVGFSLEIARTPAEQSRGLMFRPSLERGTGMLFVYEAPRTARFWMKNTMIPLDMIFIDDSGQVVNVAARTEPYSLATRASEGPVRAVLEINGGRAEALGIGPGTQAIHPAFRESPDPHRCPAAD